MPLNLLSFDTSTETLSIGLSWQGASGAELLTHEAEGGRESSASLIPAVMGLLGKAGLSLRQLDAIVFGQGPGSFTGLRTACAVAQGLAWGAGVPVLPVETLLAVAEEARHRTGANRVVALLDARMDEVYGAAYEHLDGRWRRVAPITLGAPEAVVVPAGYALAGNVFASYGDRLPGASPCIEALPTAAALLRLAPALMAAGAAVPAHQALPLYVRDKVAQTTEERRALREASSPAVPLVP